MINTVYLDNQHKPGGAGMARRYIVPPNSRNVSREHALDHTPKKELHAKIVLFVSPPPHPLDVLGRIYNVYNKVMSHP